MFCGTSLVVLSSCHHPNLPYVPLHSCKWGNAVLISISLQLAWALPSHGGIDATWGGASVFTVGAGVGISVGGTGQSYLISNKFLEADPVLGQGGPFLTGALGMSSSGGGLGL